MARLEAAQRRVDFVEATVKIIAEFGLAGATTRRIAEAAGSPLASLHYVFKSKDELFIAVFESLINAVKPSPDEFLNTSIQETCSLLMRRTMHWLKANPDYAISQAEMFYWALRRNKKMAADYEYHSVDSLKHILLNTQHPFDEARIEQISRLFLMLIEGQLSTWFAQKNEKLFLENLENCIKTLMLFIATLKTEASYPALAS